MFLILSFVWSLLLLFTQFPPWVSNWPPLLRAQSNSSVGGLKEKNGVGRAAFWVISSTIYLQANHLPAGGNMALKARRLSNRNRWLNFEEKNLPWTLLQVFSNDVTKFSFCSAYPAKTTQTTDATVLTTPQFHRFGLKFAFPRPVAFSSFLHFIHMPAVLRPTCAVCGIHINR